jgi:ribosomal protein S18 acetylase RimI-like enzyme
MTTFDVRGDTFKIHAIPPGDLDAVLGVYRGCEDFLALGPEGTASMEMVRKDIETSNCGGGIFCGIYTSNGRIIGVVDYVPRNFEGDSQAAFLSLLMIATPHRNRGIGTAAVVTIEREIGKDARVTAIFSGVQVNNHRAVRFWRRNGYRIISGPGLMPDRTIAVRLRKDFPQRA